LPPPGYTSASLSTQAAAMQTAYLQRQKKAENPLYGSEKIRLTIYIVHQMTEKILIYCFISFHEY
jgi:hypothetical protein